MMQNKYTPLLLILLAWAAVIALINPIGNFPLNDDWAYAKPVSALINNDTLILSDWQGVTLLSQIAWGYLTSLLFGFSFNTLRFSTLLLAVIAIITSYRLLIDITKNKQLSIIGTLLIAFNPLFLQLSNSFMTEIPFLTFSILALYFYFQFYKKERRGDYILALIFSLLSVMERQSGIALVAAFAIVWIIQKEKNLRNIIYAILPCLLSLISLALFEFILKARNNLPVNYNMQFHMLMGMLSAPSMELFKKTTYYLFTSSLAIGLYLLPITIPYAMYIFRNRIDFKKNISFQLIALSIFIILIFLRTYFTGKYLPFSGDIFYDAGMGPLILSGINGNFLPHFGKEIWMGISILSAASTVLLLTGILSTLKKNKQLFRISSENNFTSIFSIAICLFYILPTSTVYIADRYLLFLLPFILILFFISMGQIKINIFSYRISLVVLLPMLVFGVASARDYMEFNRTRWNALNYLTEEQHVSPKQIDGGFEFNAWYLCDFKKYDPSKKRWWWVEQDEYMVSPAILSGYKVEKEYRFTRWVNLKTYYIYILKKQI